MNRWKNALRSAIDPRRLLPGCACGHGLQHHKIPPEAMGLTAKDLAMHVSDGKFDYCAAGIKCLECERILGPAK